MLAHGVMKKVMVVMVSLLLMCTEASRSIAQDAMFWFCSADYSCSSNGEDIRIIAATGSKENEIKICIRNEVDLKSARLGLLFDTSKFGVSRIERSERGNAFEVFNWNSTEEGIEIFMSVADMTLNKGWGNVAIIHFDVSPNTPSGRYNIIISDVVVRDSLYNEMSVELYSADIVVTLTTLSLGEGRGFPGSSGNIVNINLENDYLVNTLKFYVHFEQTVLSICPWSSDQSERCIHQTARAVGGHFGYILSPGRVRIFWHNDFHTPPPGSGAMYEIEFKVAEDAHYGAYELILADSEAAGSLGSYPPTTLNGNFIVLPQGDVNGDENVDIVDIILTIDIILSTHQPTLTEFSMADCLDDDEVNILDVVCIVNIILGD